MEASRVAPYRGAEGSMGHGESPPDQEKSINRAHGLFQDHHLDPMLGFWCAHVAIAYSPPRFTAGLVAQSISEEQSACCVA
jgi:hypothetical protein